MADNAGLSAALDGIPMVADAAARDARFPLATRKQNQRVFRLDTQQTQRWSGSSWVSDALAGRLLDNGGAWVHVEHPDYGYAAGLTNHAPVIQAALDTGKHVMMSKGATYLIGTALTLNHSGQVVHLNGATLAATGALTSVFSVGNNGSGAFVKTDDVEIRSGFLSGLADGTGTPSNPPYAIGVLGPSTVPYSEGIGCSRIRVHKVRASGFCFGVTATGADDLVVTKCRFGGMTYYAGLGAGGYGVLAQTCFNLRIANTSFVASSTDRHAIYISADPNRTFDNNNVCKSVLIRGNRFNWTGVSGVTGFEAPIEIRSAENVVVQGNVVKGGYGGLDYDAMNGNGKNVIITGNVFTDQVAGASSRACINVTRASGSYLTDLVSITNNTLRPSGSNMYGITLGFASNVTVSGNAGEISNTIALVGIAGTLTNAYFGGNTWTADAQYAYEVAGTGNANITWGVERITLTGGAARVHWLTIPTAVRVGFVRVAAVNATSSATPTIGADEHGVVASVANDAAGLAVTFHGSVDTPTALKVKARGTDATVYLAAVTAIVGQVATITVKNQAGTTLPGASNTYTLALEVTS